MDKQQQGEELVKIDARLREFYCTNKEGMGLGFGVRLIQSFVNDRRKQDIHRMENLIDYMNSQRHEMKNNSMFNADFNEGYLGAINDVMLFLNSPKPSQYKSRIEELELTSKAKSDVIDTASHMILELREEIESQRKRISDLEKEGAEYRRALRFIRDMNDEIENTHGDPGQIAIAALNPLSNGEYKEKDETAYQIYTSDSNMGTSGWRTCNKDFYDSVDPKIRRVVRLTVLR